MAVDEATLASVRFNSEGLIPAIVQSAETKRVLMLAWMNEESLLLTQLLSYLLVSTSNVTQTLGPISCFGHTRLEQSTPSTTLILWFFGQLNRPGQEDPHHVP